MSPANFSDSKEFYERTSERFWDPRCGMAGRDLVVHSVMHGYSGSVLEYGCGAGSLLLGLAKQDRFSHCVGVDISEAVLASIRQAWDDIRGDTPRNKVDLVLSDHDRLPTIEDESMDVVITAATIEHVLDPYVVLDELFRVAKRNAHLVCVVPNYAYLKNSLGLFFGIQPRTGTDEPVKNWRSIGWDGGHLHTFTKSSLTTLLSDCGWKPKVWTGWGSRFSSLGFEVLRRRFPGLLSGELVVACDKTP